MQPFQVQITPHLCNTMLTTSYYFLQHIARLHPTARTSYSIFHECKIHKEKALVNLGSLAIEN